MFDATQFNTPEGVEDARTVVSNLALIAEMLNVGLGTVQHDEMLREAVLSTCIVTASLAHTCNAIADSREAEVIGASITRDDDGSIGYI